MYERATTYDTLAKLSHDLNTLPFPIGVYILELHYSVADSQFQDERIHTNEMKNKKYIFIFFTF